MQLKTDWADYVQKGRSLLFLADRESGLLQDCSAHVNSVVLSLSPVTVPDAEQTTMSRPLALYEAFMEQKG